MALGREKDGRWRVMVYDRMVGRMRHVGRYRTKREALTAERDAIARLAGRGESVGSFAARWTLDYPRPKPSTNLHNAERVAKFVERYKTRRMDEIDRPVAAAWGRARKGDVPALRAMWSDAAREGLVQHNPFSQLGIATTRGRRDLPPGWLTERDIDRLERSAAEVHGEWGPVAAALLRTCALTGVRAGEAFGLEWEDVDYRARTLRIRQAVCSKTGTLQLPKSGRPRTVALPERAAFALRMIEGRHPTIVFPSPRGARLRGSSWAYLWRPIKAGAGRPDLHLHELRHYCATRLVESGLPAWQVARQLGHQDGGTLVAELYGHPSDELALSAVRDAFDA